MILDPHQVLLMNDAHRADLQEQFRRARLSAEIGKRWIRRLAQRWARFGAVSSPTPGTQRDIVAAAATLAVSGRSSST